jgi:3-phenylpropionate/cinnamic acid dioxygenase small subunit
MDENELGRIEQLLIKVVDAKLGDVSAKFDAKLEQFKHEIITEFDHQITLQTEGFQHGLAVVSEAHQMLSEKLERVETGLSEKIDRIATDLSAHRADTEAHRGVYLVKEGN